MARPKKEPIPAWMSTGKLAELLDVNPETIHRYIRTGKIPQDALLRLPGGDWRFDANKLREVFDPSKRPVSS